jgi:putative two-component system response regulator
MSMPGESGIQLVHHVIIAYPTMAIVMVTGIDDPAVAALALEAGAHGYVVKPFTPNEILINVANATLRKKLEEESRGHRDDLVKTVRERTEDLWKAATQLDRADVDARTSVEEMAIRLSRAAELRDPGAVGHLERMSRYSGMLAAHAGLDPETRADVLLASRLHDAGKIGIPDRLLRKRGKFTPEDYEIMREHAAFGYRLFEGSGARVLQVAAVIAYTHHEWWDGGGYPRGISGESIPIEGRIAAIADVFDALSSRRPYKPAYAIGQVVEIMRGERGVHFDPELLDVFLSHLDEAVVIGDRYAD